VILHGNWNFDENVVFGFGLNIDGELLDAKIDSPRDLIEPGPLKIHASIRDAQKLAHALHDCCFRRLHLEETAEDSPQDENAYDSIEDECQNLRRIHV
jgi:hypothetical protein